MLTLNAFIPLFFPLNSLDHLTLPIPIHVVKLLTLRSSLILPRIVYQVTQIIFYTGCLWWQTLPFLCKISDLTDNLRLDYSAAALMALKDVFAFLGSE